MLPARPDGHRHRGRLPIRRRQLHRGELQQTFEANTIAAFGTSILVSVASAVIGAIVGALASYALVIGSKPNGLLRRMQEAKLQQMRFVSDASHELRTPIAVIQAT